jgi:hypothetical protein
MKSKTKVIIYNLDGTSEIFILNGYPEFCFFDNKFGMWHIASKNSVGLLAHNHIHPQSIKKLVIINL